MPNSPYPVSTDFINLHQFFLGEYTFFFRSDLGASKGGFNFHNEGPYYQFKCIADESQELNLIYVDSAFPKLLADVVLNSYANQIRSFEDYLMFESNLLNKMNDFGIDFMKVKFMDFVHLLLYADISNPEVKQIEIKRDKIYCSKNENHELNFYSIYEHRILQNLLMKNMQLNIFQVFKDEKELVLKLDLVYNKYN